MKEYGVTLTKLEDAREADCVIVAVAHQEVKMMELNNIRMLYTDSEEVLSM